jgi:parallel beta-helix repeat protein
MPLGQTPISGLPVGVAPTGAEIFPADQSGITSQLTLAQVAALSQGGLTAVDSGAANIYVLTTPKPITTLVVGQLVQFTAAHSNTGPSTIAFDGLAAAAVISQSGNALTGGELSVPVLIAWTGSQWQIILGSITPDKARTAAEIAASVVPVNYLFTPGDARRYGVVGNGVTNDTTAFQNALNVQQDVFVASGLNCLVTGGLSLQFDGQTLYGAGWDSQITCNGANINAVTLSGRNRCAVRDLFVAYTGTTSSGLNGAAVAVFSSSNECSVRHCRLQGIRGGVTINTAINTWVTDNLIDSINPPDVGWDIAVYLAGTHNTISRNKCFGGIGAGTTAIGTSGIYLISDNTHACDWNIITENEVGQHSQYGILLYANLPGGSTQHNTVIGNIIHDITGLYNSGTGQVFGAGIYLASSEWTTVSGNFLYNTNINTTTQTLTPGAIGVGGVSCFTLVGNVIRAPVWFGIYIATDGNGSGGGIVDGNVVTSAGKDGIFLSAISNVRVSNNTVFGSTNNGISYTNSTPGTGISIQNNQVRNITSTGILLTQLQCPNISGNYIGSCATGFNLTSTVGGIVNGNEFRNNTGTDVFVDNTNSGIIHFDRNTVRSAATNGVNDSFGLAYGINDVAGQTNPFTGSVPYDRVLATSATPSVLGSLSANYAGATAVTDLLNGYPGQRITIRSNGTPTFKHNAGAAGTKLMLQGAVDFVMANQNTLTLELLALGGPWYEISRKT